MSLKIKYLGVQPYAETWQAMQNFTANRTEHTEDEIWFLEHPPVFTQGLNGKEQHILQPFNDIPIVKTDRGGQITYHAPGQLIAYILIDLKRLKMTVKHCVHTLESVIIKTLAHYQINAIARADAPGVYVNDQKIASLGLKIKRHCTYHGLALNINMDLTPFNRVNPCGLEGMKMTQINQYCPGLEVSDVLPTLEKALLKAFSPHSF